MTPIDFIEIIAGVLILLVLLGFPIIALAKLDNQKKEENTDEAKLKDTLN